MSTQQKVGQCLWKRAVRSRHSVMAIGSDRSSMLRREGYKKGLPPLAPLNSCFHTLPGPLGAAPEQPAPCLPSLEAALATQRSSPPEPSMPLSTTSSSQGTQLSAEGAAAQELETHVPPLSKPGERLPASEAVGSHICTSEPGFKSQLYLSLCDLGQVILLYEDQCFHL